MRWSTWVVAALLAVVLAGCGGKKSSRRERPIRPSEDEEAQAAPPTTPTQPAVKQPVATAPAGQKPAPQPAESETEETHDAPPVRGRQPAPKRPADFADWEPGDFRSALLENDSRLSAAVLVLGKSKPDDDQAAELLISLIETPEGGNPRARPTSNDDEQEIEYTPQAGGRIGSVAEAVVAALAENGSPRAVEALKSILRGDFKSNADAKALVKAAIRAMSDSSRPEYAAIMYSLLTSPEEIRPSAIGGMDAAALQKECFFVTGKTLSQSIRASLARHVAKAGVPTGHRDLLLPYLLKPDVNNLDAQVVLYAHDAIGDVQGPVQKIWTDLAPRVIDRFLDVSRERVSLGEEKNLSQEDLCRAAQALWSPDCAKAIKAQISDEQEDLQAHQEMLRVAASLPVPVVRAALHDTVSQHWIKWSKWFDDKKFDMKGLRDPGLLLVVRSMPREEDPERRRVKPGSTGLSGRTDEEGNPISASGKAKKAKVTEQQEKEKKRKIEPAEQLRRDKRAARYVWQSATEKLVQANNQRFHAAALARAKMAAVDKRPDERSGSLRDELLPFPLHPDAEVSAWYKLTWPDDLRDGFGEFSVPPLMVRYVRMEVQDSFGRLLRHYKEQLDSPQEFVIERGKWLESQTTNAESEWMRSIDVQISRQAEMPPNARETNESLLIEILVVEAPDPTSGATRDRVAAHRKD